MSLGLRVSGLWFLWQRLGVDTTVRLYKYVNSYIYIYIERERVEL